MPPERADLQHGLVRNDAFFRLLGVELTDVRKDEAILSLPFRADLTQPTGILHGGLYAVIIDSAIAQALLTTLQPAYTVVTVHLDTKYFAPVTSGCVSAFARIVRKGKRIAHGDAELRDDNGKALARGWGVFAVTRFS